MVLFVVDGRVGPVVDDHEIAAVLRRAQLPVVLVANKLDDPDTVAAVPEIYQLGLGEPVLISAMHGLGTGDLLDRLVEVAEAGRPVEDADAGLPGRSQSPSSAVPTPASPACSTPSSVSRAPS